MRRYRLFQAIFAFALLVSFASFSYAIEIPKISIGQSPNPVGSGARAMGMGGAFIAVADDATAASWNPAGLVQLERPELSVVGAYNFRGEDVNNVAHPELDGTNNTDGFNLNYLSAAYPFTLFKRNMVVSLNYQRLYDFNMDFSGRFNENIISGGTPVSINLKDKFHQEGALTAVSPAFAVQVMPNLSVGFTLNIWTNPFERFGWKSDERTDFDAEIPSIPASITGTTESNEKDFFYGTNFNVGVMYNLTPAVTVAAVYKSGFIANIRREKTEFDVTTSTFSPLPPVVGTSLTSERQFMNLTMPESYGAGAAYRISDALTAALDVYRTEWGEFILNTDGAQTRPNIQKPQSQSKMKATNQVRLGGEYLIIEPKYAVPIRAGVFYDPEPSENNPNDFYGLAVGTGYERGPVAFDVAYTFRTGRTGESIGIPATTSRIVQHSALFSVIYHF